MPFEILQVTSSIDKYFHLLDVLTLDKTCIAGAVVITDSLVLVGSRMRKFAALELSKSYLTLPCKTSKLEIHILPSCQTMAKFILADPTIMDR